MYKYPVVVEFEDVDAYGIIHHPRFLYYFERARVHFFAGHDIYVDKIDTGIVLRNINITLKEQLKMMDEIDIEVRVKNIGKFKFDFDYTVVKDSKIVAKCTIEIVTIDLSNKKITPIPEKILSAIKTIEVNE